jgi:hypothetical protein
VQPTVVAVKRRQDQGFELTSAGNWLIAVCTFFGGPIGVVLLGASPNGGTSSGSFLPALIGSYVLVGVVIAVLLKITGPRGFTRPKASLMVSEVEPGISR